MCIFVILVTMIKYINFEYFDSQNLPLLSKMLLYIQLINPSCLHMNSVGILINQHL